MGRIYQHGRCKSAGMGIYLLLLIAAVALSACGGGGGEAGGGGTVNRAPTASAGADQTVAELTVVNLNGSGSDPDAGDTLTFAWTQTAGQTVTINNANMAMADFMAPDVMAGAPEVLTFRLSVSDGNGGNTSDTTDVTVQEPQAMVTISGEVQYEFVPPNGDCFGLDYSSIVVRPIRQAMVEIWDTGSNTLIDSIVSSETGFYEFTVVANTDVFIRVRAELKRTGNPSWDVEVRDNTANTNDPLAMRPLYVLNDAFNTSGLDMPRNPTAATGWDDVNSRYDPVRAAAPFSVLDAIYSAMSMVVTEIPQANFAPLDVFWSINNSSSPGVPVALGTSIDDDPNIASGELGTSFYRGDANALFLLGAEDDDTEEFDDHVIVHEWGHYFEDNFSRSDSIGGAHSLGDRLDMRVAFGEGWATALSGIGLNDPIYCDTGGAAQASRQLRIDIENSVSFPAGWYNEIWVMSLVYDLWDSEIDVDDIGSMGFGPIYNVMTNAQAVTPAFTSIFTFATALKAENPGQAVLIDSLLGRDGGVTASGINIYGDGEANVAGGAPDVTPIYKDVQSGTPFNICSNSQFDSGRFGNKLSEHRYLRMNIPVASRYTFDIRTDANTLLLLPPDDPMDDRDQSDPDILIYRNGLIQNVFDGNTPQGLSGDANQEVFTTLNTLAAGDYVFDFNEFRYEDDQSPDPPDFPPQACFDITITPFP